MVNIKGKGFILRHYRKGDENSLRKNINNKIISRNTAAIPYPYTIKDARKWIKKSLNKNDKKNKVFAIDINGEVVGSVGLHKIEGHQAELGYWLAEKYWGRGITTQAAKLATEYSMKTLGLKRVYAKVFPWNKASMRVLEKAGFKHEGYMRKALKKNNKYIDEHLFAKVS